MMLLVHKSSGKGQWMKVVSALAIVLAAGQAGAQAAPEGCFARVYSNAHLAKNPAQVVREISVAFGDFAGDDAPWADVLVVTADQGHVAGTGQGGSLFGQIARCSLRGSGRWVCSAECDGGSLEITRMDRDSLVLRTSYFLTGSGDDCGGTVDLAEVPDQPVSYRLNRLPDTACAGRW